jgi:DNA adenine methylase
VSTEAEMKIGAIAPWFGGKRTMAPVIVQELGPHRAYWEPLCGSMAVLMSKSPCRQETVVDLHGDLINLARVIQCPGTGAQLYRRLRRTLMHEETLREASEILKISIPVAGDDLMHVGRAWAFFVTSWCGRNGSVGTEGHARTATFCIRYTANGGDSATRFRGAVESIPAWRRRMRNVTILNRDAFAVIEKIADEPGCVIYADPPYLVKGAKYIHDFGEGFMGQDDHARLADLLRRFKSARVVVSYYAHPRLQELYPGWTVVDCTTNKNMASVTSGNAVRKAPEVLLINGKSYTAEKAEAGAA